MSTTKNELDMKPRMVKRQFVEDVNGISVVLANDLDRFSNGWLIMSITDCGIHEDGKQIASIRCSVGGEAMYIKIGSREWSIGALEMYKIAKQADDEYLRKMDGAQ